MAVVATLLNAVTTNTIGSATEITDDFDLKIEGNFDGGMALLLKCEVEDGVYVPVGMEATKKGPGWVWVKNTGANWYKGQTVGMGPAGTCTMKVIQAS
jgi:hypothetical protein